MLWYVRSSAGSSPTIGAMSSMLDSPIGSSAASTFCEATSSRLVAVRPRARSHLARASSMFSTATATWEIFLIFSIGQSSFS